MRTKLTLIAVPLVIALTLYPLQYLGTMPVVGAYAVTSTFAIILTDIRRELSLPTICTHIFWAIVIGCIAIGAHFHFTGAIASAAESNLTGLLWPVIFMVLACLVPIVFAMVWISYTLRSKSPHNAEQNGAR